MPAETSNAPARLWQDVHDGTPVGIPTLDRRWPQQTEYVRRDLVVPTLDELAEAGQRMFGWDLVHAAHFAELTHRLLLSRIEGDNDEQ